jgi:hypothetical protein
VLVRAPVQVGELGVQRGRALAGGRRRAGAHGHVRAQHHLGELAVPGRRHPHGAARAVGVPHDDDARRGGQVQEPQHVALGERRDQQLLRVVPRGVAPEGRVRGPEDRRLARDLHLVVAAVGGVPGRPGLAGAGPDDVGGVAVQQAHASA